MHTGEYTLRHEQTYRALTETLESFISLQASRKTRGEAALNFHQPGKKEKSVGDGVGNFVWDGVRLTRQSITRAVVRRSHFGRLATSPCAGSEWSVEFDTTHICGYQCDNAMQIPAYGLCERRQECILKVKALHDCDHMGMAISHVREVQTSQPMLMRGLKPGRFVGVINLSITRSFCLIAQANCWTCRKNLCHVIATQTPSM